MSNPQAGGYALRVELSVDGQVVGALEKDKTTGSWMPDAALGKLIGKEGTTVNDAENVLRKVATERPPTRRRTAEENRRLGRQVRKAVMSDSGLAQRMEVARRARERYDRLIAAVRKKYKTAKQLENDVDALASVRQARRAARLDNLDVAEDVVQAIRKELATRGAVFGGNAPELKNKGKYGKEVRQAVADAWPQHLRSLVAEGGDIKVRVNDNRGHYRYAHPIEPVPLIQTNKGGMSTHVHEYGHAIQDRVVGIDKPLRDAFWRLTEGEELRNLYDSKAWLGLLGQKPKSHTSEFGMEDHLPDRYAGRTYPKHGVVNVDQLSPSPDRVEPLELFTMLSEAMLHGTSTTVDWLTGPSGELADLFLGSMVPDAGLVSTTGQSFRQKSGQVD